MFRGLCFFEGGALDGLTLEMCSLVKCTMDNRLGKKRHVEKVTDITEGSGIETPTERGNR